MPFIESVATALPPYCHLQKDILKFMQAFAPEQEHRKLSIIYKKSGIEKRYSIIADYGEAVEKWGFFPNNAEAEPFPNVEKRMLLFEQEAIVLAEKLKEKRFQGS